jgi:hypothetical protein
VVYPDRDGRDGGDGFIPGTGTHARRLCFALHDSVWNGDPRNGDTHDCALTTG